MGKNSNFFLKLGLFFGTLFVCVFVLEVSLRLYQFVRHGIPLLYDEAPVWHEFGWEGKEIRGDVDTQKLKILLVGDSYTEGCNLDPAKMYYAYLKKVLDAEIFVYAGIGYGTAQEYLVLQRYVKQIEPDLVILQVSSNDFWDNVRQLDIAILVIRKYMRPYYIAQRMEYHTPHSFQLMQGPLGNLRVARVVYYQLQRLRIDKKYAILNGHIESQGIQHEGLQASLQVTSELMQKIKQLVNDIPLVVFLADDRMPYNAQWKNICDRQGILFIDGIASAVDAHEAWGLSCKISDRIHWNEQGQQIAGELLARHLAAFLSRHGSDKKVFPDTLKQ